MLKGFFIFCRFYRKALFHVGICIPKLLLQPWIIQIGCIHAAFEFHICFGSPFLLSLFIKAV